jgi:PAS domain S-box-containing protein
VAPVRRPAGTDHVPTVTETLLDPFLNAGDARGRTLADAIPALLWQEDAAGACVFVNRAWLDLTGRALADELGRGWLSGIHPDDRARLAGPVTAARCARQPFEAEFRLRAADGGWRWVLGRAVPRFDAGGGFLGYLGSGLDITGRKHAEIARHEEEARDRAERRAAEEALRMSEQRLRVTYDNAFAGFAELDLDGRVINANARLAEILGYSHAEVLTMSLLSVTDPRDADADAACFRRMAAGEIDSYQLEKRVTRKDGRQLWVALAASLVRDADQRPLYSMRVIVDITQLKAAEDQRKLLLGELNHRVKNTLAIVQSIAAQTQRSAPSPARFVEAFDARLLALSQAHNLLTRESWQGADLDDLLRETLRPHGVGEVGTRIALSGPAVRVGPAAAVAIGMAFHELATNAVKYGALSAESGRVDVVWRVEPAADGGPDRLVVEWRESGGPPVVPPTRRGFGSRMIERGLTGQLECAVELTFPPDGVRCRVAVPLSARVLTA